MKKIVNVISVELRSVASATSGTKLGTLELGNTVELIEDLDGWQKVRAGVAGADVTGFIPNSTKAGKVTWSPPAVPTLRDPVSNAREALVAAAIAEWVRFDHGTGEESKDPFYMYIGEYWALQKYPSQQSPYDGRNRDWPWSAVFISFAVEKAKATDLGYAKFRQAIKHSLYMWQAIKANASGDLQAPFWGVPLGKAQPKVGDIIGNWREDRKTYDSYLTAASEVNAKGHCDIVVAVSPEVAWTIGGNVGQPRRPDPGQTEKKDREQTCGITGYQLSKDGFLLENKRMRRREGKPDVQTGGAIVLMDNRL